VVSALESVVGELAVVAGESEIVVSAFEFVVGELAVVAGESEIVVSELTVVVGESEVVTGNGEPAVPPAVVGFGAVVEGGTEVIAEVVVTGAPVCAQLVINPLHIPFASCVE